MKIAAYVDHCSKKKFGEQEDQDNALIKTENMRVNPAQRKIIAGKSDKLLTEVTQINNYLDKFP
jgi:hypothetical protein